MKSLKQTETTIQNCLNILNTIPSFKQLMREKKKNKYQNLMHSRAKGVSDKTYKMPK